MKEPRYLYCPNCKKWVGTEWTDEGIGAYEFWGSLGNDVQWCESCEECGVSADELLEDEPRCECCKAPETAADDFKNNEGLCKTCWESDPEYIARVGKGELICQI